MHPTIRVVERDGDVIRVIATGDFGEIEAITEMWLEGDTMLLNQLHLGGPGKGTVGISVLRDLARQFARENGAARIRIVGGVRTTGANKGHRPRPIEIEVN